MSDTPAWRRHLRRVGQELLIREDRGMQTDRARLVRVALEAVVGDEVRRLVVEDGNGVVHIGGADGRGRFGVWTTDERLGDEPPPFLEHAIEVCADELTETSAFWGVRLPLCPRHPDAHALALEVGADAVVGTCPVSGVVRTVPC